MSIRRMMLFALGAKIKNLIEAFKTRVFAQQGEFEAETCLDATLTDLDNKGLLDNASLVVTPNAYEENLLFNVVPDNKNLVLFSQDFTQTVWLKGGATIVSSTRVAPDGTSTGTELSDVGASGTPGVPIQSFITTSTALTFSIYTKAVSLPTNGRRRFLLRNGTTSTNFDILNFNYSSTGNLGNGWFSENVGNGWFRLSYTRTSGINIGDNLIIYYGRGDTAPVGATDVWQVWGAQVEVGNSVTSYQATLGANNFQVTRATTATRVNEVGEIEQVPYNLLLRSEEFDNTTVWSNLTTGTGVTPIRIANSVLSPINTSTADTIVFNRGVGNTATDQSTISQTISSAFGNYTFSVYVKATTLSDVGKQIFIRCGNTGTLQAVTLTIDWQRVSTTTTFTSLVSANVFQIGNRGTFTNSNSVSVDIWGAQLVRGTQPKDYFPTTNRFNVPRIDYSNGSCPAILVEQQSRNEIRNNTMVGAVVGTPGTLPTNWTDSVIGLTREVVGLGVENGVEYIDIRYFGTASVASTQRTRFESGTQIVAATGQTWTLSSYIKVIAQPQPPTSYRLRMFENTSAGVEVTTGFVAISPTTTLQRFSYTRTLSGGATVARVQPVLDFATTTGQAYDFTIRVGLPQMEQRPNATSVIPTTTAAVTRNADVITRTGADNLIGQTEGAMFVDFNYQRFNPLADSFIATISDGTLSNHLIFAVLTTGNAAAILRTSETNVIFISIPAASFTFGRKKIVVSYKSGETNLYVNGVKIGSTITTAFSFPVTINKFNLGSAGTNGGLSDTTINSSALYKTALTDAQAIQLTTL